MAKSLASYACPDEDYIDMELTSSPSKILYCSSPLSKEFEFQMSFTCNDKQTTTSSADELFYQGQLLPLHPPPRRQIVKNLLHTTTAATFEIAKEPLEEDHYYSMSLINSTNTPLDSCNISPSQSCRISCDELKPDDYFFEWSNELSSFISNHPTKKPWSKKLKLIKHSTLSQKLKASRAYLKSIFIKSVCSEESFPKANSKAADKNLSEAEVSSNKYLNFCKQKPLELISRASYPRIGTLMKKTDKVGIEGNVQRRSFSGAIKRHSTSKCLSSSSSSASSSSSSFNLSCFHELDFLRRSSSATDEIEISIDAAIAHCKKSMQDFYLIEKEDEEEEFDEKAKA